MTPIYISTYKEWEELSEIYNFNPAEVIEFSLDEGGGNSTDFKYTSSIPEKEDSE